MNNPELILYDVGDTLLETTGYEPLAGIRRLLSLAHTRDGRALPEAEAVLKLSLELNDVFETRCEGTALEYSQQAFQRLLYGHFGIRFDRSPEEIELEYWKEALSFAPEPGVAHALEAVRRAGYRQAVISNTAVSEKTIRHELARHGLEEYFEFLVATADYGLRKPHHRVFTLALGLAGVTADRAWYVGNTLRYDVRGAAGAGLTPVWYNRVGQHGELPAGALELAGWSDFVELLREETDEGS